MESKLHISYGATFVDDVPGTLELVIGNQIYIAKEALSPSLRNHLLRLAAFQNPDYKAQSMRLPTYDKPRIIACAEDLSRHIGLPRGCLDDLLELLSDLRIASVIRDERFPGVPIDVRFRGGASIGAEDRGRGDARP